MKEYELACRYCKRFLQKVENSGTFHIKCSNSACRKLRNGLDKYKIVFMSDMAKHTHKES